MRTIKFRGKRLYDGKWVYGYVLGHDTLPYMAIVTMNNTDKSVINKTTTSVDPDTIGQFTSLYDKNGKEIYEGDILKAGDSGLLEVRFVRGVFAFLWNGNLDDEFPTGSPTHEWAEVIGNKHDNPELLEIEKVKDGEDS